MRNPFLLLFLPVLLTACVDSDYDISNVDTDDITIGTDGDAENAPSEFRIPLARVRITLDEIASGQNDVQAIFAEADVWLPTTLEGGYADIVRLQTDANYLSALQADLVDEMMRSDEKLKAVTDKIREKYLDEFLPLLPGVTGNETADEFYDLFHTAFRAETALRERLSDQIRNLARDYLTDLTVDEMSYDVGRIDLSGDVVDMLAKNLDPKGTPDAKNTLHLYGEIASKLPLTLSLEALFTPTAVRCPVHVDAQQAINPIAETRLYEEDLRQIVDGMRIILPVTFEKYYPGIGFDRGADEQMRIDLRLVKRGGLTLEF